MNFKTKVRLKRSISAVSAIAMAISAAPQMSVFAVTGNTHYDFDGYSVDYTINSEWVGHQSVAVKITNTGDEPILNWALGYNAQGDIEGIWNGYVSAKDDDGYIIKNAGYNYEIEPNSSVSFGYTLSGLDLSVPDDFKILSKRVDKTDGFDVYFNKVSDWDSAFQGEIVVLNTSDEPLEAWTVDFDSSFEINSLWGGRILSSDDGHYEISAEGWTNPIAPNSQVTIGFIGTALNDDTVITNTSLSSVVTGRDDDGADPTELAVTANGEYADDKVTLSWNSTVNNGSYEILYSADNTEFADVGTTKATSYEYTPNTDVSGDVYFKIRQTTTDGRIAESPVVIVNIPAPVVKATPVIDIATEYSQETGYVNAEWTTTVEGGKFTVSVSHDGAEISSCDVTDTNAFTFKPEKSGEYTIEVVQTTAIGMKGEKSVSLNVTVPNTEEPLPDIDWEDDTDTDNDDLPDEYEENYFGTNPENADTDGDGLPDGYEVLSLGTDPTKADTDENGINDGDEDLDEDKLSNREEYDLGTDPHEKDTDDDDLSDYDEVKIHSTDPLKFDTDEDGISDGDEIALGLDPLSAATNGVPDNERTFVQHIGEDSEVFSRINTIDNPYKVSIDIDCAGVAENNLYSSESGYSNAMSNPAIVGIIPEFEYKSYLKVEDVIVNFELNSSIIKNTNGKFTNTSDEFMGIRRFNVFCYFEENNILLPIETLFDENNNRVYAHTDRLGTYCLMDMEIWLHNLGIDPNNDNEETLSHLTTRGKLDVSNKVPNRTVTDALMNSSEEYIDIAIAVYQTNYTELVKKELKITCEEIFRRAANIGKKVRIYFVSAFGTSIGGATYVSNLEEANATIDCVPNMIHELMESTDARELWHSLKYIDNDLIPMMGDDKYIFIVDVGCEPIVNTANKFAADIKNNTNNFYAIYGKFNCNKADYMSLVGENTYEMYVADSRYNFADHIVNVIFGEELFGNMIITSCGLVPMPEDFGEISRDSDQDYDFDGLLDRDEIFFDSELISRQQTLPTLQECIDYTAKTKKLTYVENGLTRFLHININNTLFTDYVRKFVHVVPLISDPTNEDGDDDGLLDGKRVESAGVIIAPVDNKPLRYNGDKNVWKLHIELMLTGQSASGYRQDPYTVKEAEYLASIGLVLGATGEIQPFRNKYMTPLGAKFLGFRWDNKNQALHSKPFPQWQAVGGYSDLYDRVFNLGTGGNMRRDKLEMYDSQNNKYILWFWRGDYINLGSGAEIGVYLNAWDNEDDFSIVSITLPMTLELYYCDYYGARNIYNWHPTEEQWWITGFSPDYMNPNVNDLFMIGSVDLSKDARMYDTLWNKYHDLEDYSYLIFDDEYHTVWFEWNSYYNVGL